MSLTLLLQRNMSERNKLDKSITTLFEMTGTLKEQTSIIDPIIKIECDLTDVVNCNYMTVLEFNRMYFVNNIKSIRSDLVEFTCHVDVLSTYASEIRGNRGITRRQQYNWNLYLNDGSFKVYQNPMVLTKAFPSGFTTQEFVLAVAGS